MYLGQDRRVRADRGAVRDVRASLHEGAVLGGAAGRSRRRRRDEIVLTRRGAVAARSAVGLPLPPALPLRHGAVLARRRRRSRRWRRTTWWPATCTSSCPESEIRRPGGRVAGSRRGRRGEPGEGCRHADGSPERRERGSRGPPIPQRGLGCRPVDRWRRAHPAEQRRWEAGSPSVVTAALRGLAPPPPPEPATRPSRSANL